MTAKIFLLLGVTFFLISAMGVLKFPDVFSRMHAASKASSLALGLILIGVVIHFFSWLVLLKSFLIVIFIFLTAPVSAHILSRAGYVSGANVWKETVEDEMQQLHDRIK